MVYHSRMERWNSNDESGPYSQTPKIDADRIRAGKFANAAMATETETSKSIEVSLVDTHLKLGVARGFEVHCDEPEEIGGRDAAPQPTEFMLLSLGFCQMSITIYFAAIMRIELDDIAVEVTGHRDDRGIRGVDGVRPGYHTFEIATTLFSDESEERLRELTWVAGERCPVSDNLANPTKLVRSLVVERPPADR